MIAHLLAIAALCALTGFAFAVWLTYPPYPMRSPLWRKGMAPYAGDRLWINAPNDEVAGYNENRPEGDDYRGADYERPNDADPRIGWPDGS